MPEIAIFGRSPVYDCSPAWLATLDQAFRAGRGRKHDLVSRFPAVFGPGSSAECWTLTLDGKTASGLIALPIEFGTAGSRHLVWKFGFVHTLPEFGGRGMARRLLNQVARNAEEQGVEGLLLWAGRSDLYRGTGFMAVGSHGLAELKAEPGAAIGDVRIVERDAALNEIQRIANAVGFARDRPGDGWRATPLSADRCVCLLRDTGYLLAGLSEDGEHGYLYEMAGAPGDFPILWAGLGQLARRWTINASLADPGGAWLRGKADLEWKPNQIAWFRPFPANEDGAITFDPTLPVLDWI